MTKGCPQIQWRQTPFLSMAFMLQACSSSPPTNDGAQTGSGSWGTASITSGGSLAGVDAATIGFAGSPDSAGGLTAILGGSTGNNGGMIASSGGTTSADASEVGMVVIHGVALSLMSTHREVKPAALGSIVVQASGNLGGAQSKSQWASASARLTQT
jgi:hypothetical protein